MSNGKNNGKNKRTRTPVTQEDVQKWEQLAADGHTANEIAEATGRSPSVINRHVAFRQIRQGLQKQQEPLPGMQVTREQLADLVNEMRETFGENVRTVFVDLETGNVRVQRTEEFTLS